MRSRSSFLGLLLPVLLVFGASCGGGSDSNKSSSSGSNSNGAPAISDEEYLKALCSGTQQYYDAILAKTNVNDIVNVVKAFSTTLKGLNPPADLRTYNTDFAKYLDAAAAEPTQLLTTKPPVPGSSVRSRLAAKEANVPECKNATFKTGATFFQTDSTATAAPTK